MPLVCLTPVVGLAPGREIERWRKAEGARR